MGIMTTKPCGRTEAIKQNNDEVSVWIDYINGIECAHVDFLDELLENPLAVGLTEYYLHGNSAGSEKSKRV